MGFSGTSCWTGLLAIGTLCDMHVYVIIVCQCSAHIVYYRSLVKFEFIITSLFSALADNVFISITQQVTNSFIYLGK